MRLPDLVQEKIDRLYHDFDKQSLTQTRQNLTQKYKSHERTGRSLVGSQKESKIYAISRMPATFAVISGLLGSLASQNLISEIHSCLDVGSGTGAGYFAVSQIFEGAEIELFERDQNMIDVFRELCNGQNVPITKGDFNNFKFSKTYDMVLSSYVLSEMTENDRLFAVKKMLEISNKYVLLIDTGTPKVFEEYKKIKEFAISNGARVMAPCFCEVCPLENDYCQFYARVERTSIQKMAKSASLGFEDEKYFYLLLSKQNAEILSGQGKKFRVIRRPIFANGRVELMLCGAGGAGVKIFSKSQKEIYKRARKSKINDILEIDV